MNVNKKLAVIGLDGFDWEFDYQFLDNMPFLKQFIIDNGQRTIKCDTAPHSAPSWTTIFSGLPQLGWKSHHFPSLCHRIRGFYDFSKGETLEWEKHEGDKPWNAETIEKAVKGFIWHEALSGGKSAVAQGIMCIQPHYSFNCVNDYRAYYDGKYDSWKKAQEYCTKFQEVFDRTVSSNIPDLYCCVIQIVDQVHHHFIDLPKMHHEKTMALVDKLTEHIAKPFDKVIILSDHGIPRARPTEYQEYNIKVHAHLPRCFLTSTMKLDDVKGTLDIHEAILREIVDGYTG